MKIIEKKEIDNLYKKVGLKPDYNYGISTKLNKGTLKNKLNNINTKINVRNYSKKYTSND